MYRELSPVEVADLLVRNARGQSLRRIARETHLGRNTVSRYVRLGMAMGLSGPTPSDSLVRAVIWTIRGRPNKALSVQRLALAAQREHIRGWLVEQQRSLVELHVFLESQGIETSYATLRRFVIDEFGTARPSAPDATV